MSLQLAKTVAFLKQPGLELRLARKGYQKDAIVHYFMDPVQCDVFTPICITARYVQTLDAIQLVQPTVSFVCRLSPSCSSEDSDYLLTRRDMQPTPTHES